MSLGPQCLGPQCLSSTKICGFEGLDFGFPLYFFLVILFQLAFSELNVKLTLWSLVQKKVRYIKYPKNRSCVQVQLKKFITTCNLEYLLKYLHFTLEYNRKLAIWQVLGPQI